MNALVNDDPRGRFVVASLAELSFGMVAIGLGWLFGPDVRADVPHLTDLRGIFQGVIWGTLLGALFAYGMLSASRLPIPGLRDLEQAMEARFEEYLGSMSYAELIVLSMTAGLGEELLFRGWLQQGLTGAIDSQVDYARVLFGWVAASIMFGLAHPISRLYVMLASAMGLVLGGVYLITGNLLTAIVAHAAYDAVILVRWRMDLGQRNRKGLAP
jgi:membrane protease YdiL (CAAX protease family)